MKIKYWISLLTAACLGVTSISNAIACTTLLITDVNGNGYHARTVEFSGILPTDMTFYPSGTKIESVTPAGAPGMTFNTKYAILGMSAAVIPNAKKPFILEGVNDQGVSFSANILDGSKAPPLGTDASKILSVNDLGAWVLGNFKNVSEVKAAILSNSAEFWLPPLPPFGNLPAPVHYAVFDKKGNGIVVELFNGKLNVYDNLVNAMANGPDFPWHLQNLSNYTFTNVDKNTGQLGKLKLATQDAGIALTALPSAQTSQGRFVKAAFYANYVRKAKTPDEAIITLGHIMNNFDRPLDLTVDGSGGGGDGVSAGRKKSLSSETTNYTVMNDLSRNLFYVRSINALNWSMVDMNKLVSSVKTVKSISTYDIDKPGADIFTLFNR